MTLPAQLARIRELEAATGQSVVFSGLEYLEGTNNRSWWCYGGTLVPDEVALAIMRDGAWTWLWEKSNLSEWEQLDNDPIAAALRRLEEIKEAPHAR